MNNGDTMTTELDRVKFELKITGAVILFLAFLLLFCIFGLADYPQPAPQQLDAMEVINP